MNAQLTPTHLRALLLEDNADDVLLLQDLLEREGFTLDVVHVATREGFEEYLRPDLDVILSDHGLPQFNALQALELVRERGFDIPFIIVSGIIREEAAVEAMRMGASDYLLKDRVSRLGQAVRNALLKRQHRIEKERAHRAILERDALNRAVLESLDAQIAVVDGTGHIISANNAWERFAVEQGGAGLLRTGRYTDYLDVCRQAAEAGDAYAARALEGARGVLDGALEQFCMEYPCHDETEQRWFEMRVTPLVGVMGGGAVISHTNITERRRAAENDQRLAAIVANSSDAILGVSLAGTVLSWNAGAERIYGYSAREAIGLSLFDLTVPADRKQELTDMLVRVWSEESLEHFETRRKARDGRLLDISVTISPILNSESRVAGASIIGRDISQQKQYERRLVEAKEYAEEMSRLKSAFLNNMSHEFRTPLAGILGCAEVLTESLTGEDLEFAHMIQANGSRLMETLSSVLELASLERAEVSIKPMPLDPLQLVEEATALLRPQAEASGLRVAVQPPDTPFHVLGDHDALFRVLLHVIGNAIKFTPEGGVTVEFDARAESGQIRVTDTGIGISRAFLPHLFTEFKQASAGLGRQYEGSGLGLTLALRLARLMNGTIEVESELGRGSTFTVALPLAVA